MTDALWVAIGEGSRQRVRELLAADPTLLTATNAERLTPLMVALYRGQPGIADDLLARLTPGQLTLHEAAASGQLARVQEVLTSDPAGVNSWSPDGFQSLQLAAFFGRRPIVELLLASGGDVRTAARHPFGVTALHAALASPDPEAARLIVAAGADVNARQSGGTTPLHETAHIGHVALTRLLLEHGADPRLTASDGRTALDVAEAAGHAEVAGMLKSAAHPASGA